MSNLTFETHDCCKPEYCNKCVVNEILVCKVCNRFMSTADSYNRHIRAKQHSKLEKRYGFAPAQVMVPEEPNYYDSWPPNALSCSSPIPGKGRRETINSKMDMLCTMTDREQCSACNKTFSHNKLCIEVKACGHKYHS